MVERLIFKKGNDKFPGVSEWVIWNRGDILIPVIRCGGCNEVATLNTHTISDDGTVNPSVVCPYTKEGCNWHVWLKLEGWKNGS